MSTRSRSHFPGGNKDWAIKVTPLKTMALSCFQVSRLLLDKKFLFSPFIALPSSIHRCEEERPLKLGDKHSQTTDTSLLEKISKPKKVDDVVWFVFSCTT